VKGYAKGSEMEVRTAVKGQSLINGLTNDEGLQYADSWRHTWTDTQRHAV
jgi:hypothetical protein